MSDEDHRQRVYQDEVDLNGKRVVYMQHGDMNGGMVHPSMESENNLFFKLLCPQSITGLIIGRGGSIINQLNLTTGAKIRLSQNNEFFPTTTDRVLIINGNREGIANAVRELVTRIAEAADKKPNSNVPQSMDMYGNTLPAANRGPLGTYQIKVVIPKTASASIIGRSGTVIRRMAEVSNCKFQLSDENDPFNTKERIVTINSSTVANLVLGAQTIMIQLLEDFRHRSYMNLTTNYNAPGGGGVPNGGGGGVGGGGGGGGGEGRERRDGGRDGGPHPGSYKQQQQMNPSMQMGPPPLQLTPMVNPMMGMNPMNPPPYGIPVSGPQYMSFPPPGASPMQMQGHPMSHNGSPPPHMYSMMGPPQQQFMGPPMGPPGTTPIFAYGGPPPPQLLDPSHHQQLPYNNMQGGMVMPNGMYGPPPTGGGHPHPGMKQQ